MADVFISYASDDVELAKYVKGSLEQNGLSAFVAAMSVTSGEMWTEAIWNQLMDSRWVVVLASKKACESAYVQQEFGMALGRRIVPGGTRRIVPVVWDVEPGKLPGWMGRFQAIDLRSTGIQALAGALNGIVEDVRSDRNQTALLIGIVIAGLLIAGSKR